jgi:hypothetical protein
MIIWSSGWPMPSSIWMSRWVSQLPCLAHKGRARDPTALIARASRFRDLADAINITDGAGANCHMSSAAAAAILVANGLTPVAQFSCRDRNRIALHRPEEVTFTIFLAVHNCLSNRLRKNDEISSP